MFKNILSLALLLGLIGCSQKDNDKDIVLKQENAAALTLISGSGDMGEVTSSKLITLIVQNTGDEATVVPAMLSLTGLNSSDFSIIYNAGCNQVIAKGKRCTMKVSFSASGKTPGNYVADLNVGELAIPLSASIPQPAGGSSSSGGTGSSGLVALVNSVDSSSGISYGDLTGTQSVLKTIYIKNTGSLVAPVATVELSSTDYSIVFNQCSNVSLQPNKQCQVRVSFSASGKTAQAYNANLNFGTLSVPLSANVLGAATTTSSSGSSGGGPTVSLVVLENSIQIANPLDYGSLSGSQTTTKVLYVKNTGTVTTNVSASLNNSNFSMVFNQCNNRNLAVNGTCQIRLSFTASGKNPVQYNSILNLIANSQTIEVPLRANVETLTQMYNLVINKSGSGSISDGSLLFCGEGCTSQTVSYPVGTVVNLIATPNSENIFTGYSESCQGLSPVCQVVLDSNKTVVASFSQRLSLVASSSVVRVNQTAEVTPQGGLPPYIVSKVSGVGTLVGTSFIAGNIPGSAQFQVEDQLGTIETVTINVALADGTPNLTAGIDGLVKVSDSGPSFYYTDIGNNGEIYISKSLNYGSPNISILRKYSLDGVLISETQVSLPYIDSYPTYVEATNDGGVFWFVLAYTGGNNFEYQIRKYNSNLELDNSFANGGILVASNHPDFLNKDSLSFDSRIKADLKNNLYLAVTANDYDEVNEVGIINSYIQKYSSRGELVFSLEVNPNEIALYWGKFAILEDDSVIFASHNNSYQEPRIILKKISSNGVLDSSYGVNGTANIDYPLISSTGGFFSSFGNLVVLPSGAVVASATAYVPNEEGGSEIPLFTKVLPNGQLDTSFGNNGFASSNFGYSLDFPQYVQVSSSLDYTDGKILFSIGGNNEGTTSRVQIGRLDAQTGAFDLDFNDGQLLTAIPSYAGYETRMKVLNSGEIVWTGYIDVNLITNEIDDFLAIKRVNSILTKPVKVSGCTDEDALNFNSLAQVNDGSCNY